MYVEVFDEYKCYHSGCACLVGSAGAYCSEKCKETPPPPKCDCGHGECKVEAPKENASTHTIT